MVGRSWCRINDKNGARVLSRYCLLTSLVLFLTFRNKEPGYYQEGDWGIRIENVCVCVEVSSEFAQNTQCDDVKGFSSNMKYAPVQAETEHRFGGKQQCKFETITMTPIQTTLIDIKVGKQLILRRYLHFLLENDMWLVLCSSKLHLINSS
jgi:hypothetical protein